jgi:hypothetical protein
MGKAARSGHSLAPCVCRSGSRASPWASPSPPAVASTSGVEGGRSDDLAVCASNKRRRLKTRVPCSVIRLPTNFGCRDHVIVCRLVTLRSPDLGPDRTRMAPQALSWDENRSLPTENTFPPLSAHPYAGVPRRGLNINVGIPCEGFSRSTSSWHYRSGSV